MATTTRTALVTGATSGLGFETAAQLGDHDYDAVIVTGRTRSRARDARERLVTRTGQNVFESLDLDLDEMTSVEAAAEALIERGGTIDLLVLNAGIVPPGTPDIGPDGIDRVISSSIVGHHVLVVRLIEAGLVADGTRIVIAGSEAARGDVPMFHPFEPEAVAVEHFSGDLEAAIEAQMRLEPPARYRPGDQYATAKLLVAWWTAEIARRIPTGVTVNAVSPGSTPDTNGRERAPWLMRNVLLPLFRIVPGMSHSVAVGAARYLEVAEYDERVSGHFFASPPGKVTGALVRTELAHLTDRRLQRAGWNAIVRISGVDLITSVPLSSVQPAAADGFAPASQAAA